MYSKLITKFNLARSFTSLLIILFSILIPIKSSFADIIYESGTLVFESSGQSMWESGGAFVQEESVFLGTEWSNRTATIGGILGSANEIIIPASGALYGTYYQPKVLVLEQNILF